MFVNSFSLKEVTASVAYSYYDDMSIKKCAMSVSFVFKLKKLCTMLLNISG